MKDGSNIVLEETSIDHLNEYAYGRRIAIAVLIAFQGLFFAGGAILIGKLV